MGLANLSAIIAKSGLTLGLATAAFWLSRQAWPQHVWLHWLCALLGAVVGVVLAFIRDVWATVRPGLVERSANFVTEQISTIPKRLALWRQSRGFKARYYEHLLAAHSDANVKGLTTQGIYTLDLRELFVDLSIVPQATHQVPPDPIADVPAGLREGRHTIWEYLRAPKLADQHLVLLGAPGSGKTSLLQYLTIVLAGSAEERHRRGAPDKLPILLFLRDHVSTILNNPDYAIEEAVRESIRAFERRLTVPPEWIARHLELGRCFVCLDGLDEVANEGERQKILEWIQRQINTWRKNRFIVTSRPFGYPEHVLTPATVLSVQPFDPAQIQRFVERWYLANEIKARQQAGKAAELHAAQGAADLLSRLRSRPELTELAVNPLLLTMIATVHRYRSELPGKCVTLYGEICEVWLGKRRSSKGLASALIPAQKRLVLQRLAWWLMERGEREIALTEAETLLADVVGRVNSSLSVKEFLADLHNDSSLVLERRVGWYGFAHKTFQEYLAAVHAKEAGLEDALLAHLTDEDWHETIRLYVAQTDATAVIEACLQAQTPTVAHLQLLLDCAAEALDLEPRVRGAVEVRIDEALDSPAVEQRALAAQALLDRRLARLRPLGDEPVVDEDYITYADYQYFLDTSHSRSLLAPEHWAPGSTPVEQRRTRLVGVCAADAMLFCDWLTERAEGVWRYRLPRVDELGGAALATNPATWALGPDDRPILLGEGITRLDVGRLRHRLQDDLREPSNFIIRVYSALVLIRPA